jgi:hypothetical protein
VHVQSPVRRVDGESGSTVRLITEGPDGDGVMGDRPARRRRPGAEYRRGRLARAGVVLTETGYIAVDERLATTAPGVWALGECAGNRRSPTWAFDGFRVVHDNPVGGSRTTADRLVRSACSLIPSWRGSASTRPRPATAASTTACSPSPWPLC